MHELVRVRLENEMDLILAHKRSMKLAELAGLSLSAQTTFATAVSARPTYFRNEGHILVIVGFTEDGKVILADSAVDRWLPRENDNSPWPPGTTEWGDPWLTDPSTLWAASTTAARSARTSDSTRSVGSARRSTRA